MVAHTHNPNTQELKAGHQKFKVIFYYIASLRSVWYTWEPVKSQKRGDGNVAQWQCEDPGSILAQTNKQEHLDLLAFLVMLQCLVCLMPALLSWPRLGLLTPHQFSERWMVLRIQFKGMVCLLRIGHVFSEIYFKDRRAQPPREFYVPRKSFPWGMVNQTSLRERRLRAGNVDQLVECLPHIQEALGLVLCAPTTRLRR